MLIIYFNTIHHYIVLDYFVLYCNCACFIFHSQHSQEKNSPNFSSAGKEVKRERGREVHHDKSYYEVTRYTYFL